MKKRQRIETLLKSAPLQTGPVTEETLDWLVKDLPITQVVACTLYEAHRSDNGLYYYRARFGMRSGAELLLKHQTPHDGN